MLSTKEAAEMIGAGESSVRLWCTQGKLAGAQRVGRDWIILATALEGFVNPGRGRPAKSVETQLAKKKSEKEATK